MDAFINVGFNNMVAKSKIIAIVNPDGAVTKRNISYAKEEHALIDATQGRKTRSVIYCSSNHIILSSLQPETITGRLEDAII